MIRAGRWAASRGAADFYVAVTVAATSAAIGIVVDDTFPVGQAVRLPALWRPLALVGSVVLLTAALKRRRKLTADRGTLIHVELLPPRVRNLHRAALEEVAKDRLDLQQIVVRARVAPETGPWDLRAEVGVTDRRLADACNRDDIRTGTDISPNMTWPAALALGYLWRTTPKARLLELDAVQGRQCKLDTEVMLDLCKRLGAGPAERVAGQPLTVKFRNHTARGCRATHVFASSSRVRDGLVTGPVPVGAYSVDIARLIVVGRPAGSGSCVMAARAHHVSEAGCRRQAARDGPCVKDAGGMFDGHGIAQTEFDRAGRHVLCDGRVVTTEGFAIAFARALLRAVIADDGVVIVRAQVAKVVAFGAGVALAALLDLPGSSPRAPQLALWQRVVLLSYDEARRVNVPVRVLPEQGDPAELLEWCDT